MSHFDELEYINEVINLLDTNDFLPPKLLERAKNRVQISRIKQSIDAEKNIETKEQLQVRLKECLDKEIKYQKFFSKFHKERFLTRIIRKFRE